MKRKDSAKRRATDPDEEDKGRTVQAWMSHDLMHRLDEAAEELGWSRSQLIVRASEFYLEEIQRRRRERRPAAAPFPTPPAP